MIDGVTGGELSAHLVKYTLNCHPHFSPDSPRSLPLLIIHSPSLICPLYPKGGCGFYVCSSYHSSVGIQPMHCSAASSIVFSCAAMGIGISLLFAERPSVYLYTDTPGNPASKWRQPQGGPNPNPNPNPSLHNRGLYFADADEFHASEILAIVSSALNGLVATAL